jgi:hypothetical protein
MDDRESRRIHPTSYKLEMRSCEIRVVCVLSRLSCVRSIHEAEAEVLADESDDVFQGFSF